MSVDPTTTPGYSLKETLSNGSRKQNPGRAAQSHLSWGARAESPRTRVPNLQDLMPDYLRWSQCNNNRNKMRYKCNAELIEPNILECEVKWALGSITTNKASGGDGIPAELFRILKDDALKVLHSICQQIWKTQQWPQDWKRSLFISIPKKGNAKECSNYHCSHFPR